jgi:hypothetical protein
MPKDIRRSCYKCVAYSGRSQTPILRKECGGGSAEGNKAEAQAFTQASETALCGQEIMRFVSGWELSLLF